MSDSNLHTAFDRVSEAALRPELWRSALDEVSRALDIEGSALLTTSTSPIASCASERLDKAAEAYVAEGWFRDNPRIARSYELRGAGGLIGRSGIFLDRTIYEPEHFRTEEIERGFFERFRLRYFCGIHVDLPNAPPIVVSFERTTSHLPFGEDDLQRIDQIGRQIAVSARMTAELGYLNAEAVAATFEQIPVAAALLRKDGSLIVCNPRFEHINQSVNVVRANVVGHASPAVDRSIRSVMQSATGDGPLPRRAATCLLPRAQGRPVIASAMPLSGAVPEILGGAAALLTLKDLDTPEKQVSPAMLKDFFGFSSAEAQLAQLLAEGASLKEAAERRRVALPTARNQLASIFSKAEVSRQVDLVRLLNAMTKI